jgi:hypothetical protein
MIFERQSMRMPTLTNRAQKAVLEQAFILYIYGKLIITYNFIYTPHLEKYKLHGYTVACVSSWLKSVASNGFLQWHHYLQRAQKRPGGPSKILGAQFFKSTFTEVLTTTFVYIISCSTDLVLLPCRFDSLTAVVSLKCT